MLKDPMLRSAVGQAGNDPKRFAAETVRKLTGLIPLVLKATTPDVAEAERMMKQLFDGQRIDASALVGELEGMMTKVCDAEPSLRCVKPLLREAFGVLKGHQSLLIERGAARLH